MVAREQFQPHPQPDVLDRGVTISTHLVPLPPLEKIPVKEWSEKYSRSLRATRFPNAASRALVDARVDIYEGLLRKLGHEQFFNTMKTQSGRTNENPQSVAQNHPSHIDTLSPSTAELSQADLETLAEEYRALKELILDFTLDIDTTIESERAAVIGNILIDLGQESFVTNVNTAVIKGAQKFFPRSEPVPRKERKPRHRHRQQIFP
jgi:hypothetical protein